MYNFPSIPALSQQYFLDIVTVKRIRAEMLQENQADFTIRQYLRFDILQRYPDKRSFCDHPLLVMLPLLQRLKAWAKIKGIAISGKIGGQILPVPG